MRLLVAAAVLRAPFLTISLHVLASSDGNSGSRFCYAVVRRHGLRGRRGPPGKVPPTRGTGLLGGTGLVTCMTFVWLSAPDLAATQLVVEIVTTVLILLGLRWLPKRSEALLSRAACSRPLAPLSRPFSCRRRRRGHDGHLLCGDDAQTPDRIAHFFVENAYSEGGGRNVVNVMLVDFRGFDTLGEITVLGIVALTVFALLRRFRPAPDSIEPEQQRIQSVL